MTQTTDAGAVVCAPIGSVAMETNIKKTFGKGAMYQFQWTSLKVYYKPQVQLTFPSANYNFVTPSNHRCEILINGVLQDPLLGEYKHTCTFTAASSYFGVVFEKDLALGTVVTMKLYYIEHPATLIANNFEIKVISQVYNQYALSTTTYETECLLFAMPATFYTVTAGPTFSPFPMQINKITGYPLRSKQPHSLYFNFSTSSYLPRGTIITINFPLDYVQLNDKAQPECYIFGKVRLLTSCIPTNGVTKGFSIELDEDYIENS